MFQSMLLALAVLAAPVLPKQAAIELKGWTRDGTAIVWQVVPGGGDDGVDPMIIDYATDMDGRFSRMFRVSRAPGDEYYPQADALWRTAEPESAAEAWQKEHGLPGGQLAQGLTDKKPIAGGKERLRLGVSTGHQSCPTLTLTAEWGSIAGSLAEDRCEKNETPANTFRSSYRLAWSPDRTRAAIEWNVIRGEDNGIETISRTHMVILSRRQLASVDLLDAGHGRVAARIAGQLEKAGYAVAHRGPAKDPHPAVEIYYAPGFETEAREVATLAEVSASSVKPLSWKSPYAITVVAVDAN